MPLDHVTTFYQKFSKDIEIVDGGTDDGAKQQLFMNIDFYYCCGPYEHCDVNYEHFDDEINRTIGRQLPNQVSGIFHLW